MPKAARYRRRLAREQDAASVYRALAEGAPERSARSCWRWPGPRNATPGTGRPGCNRASGCPGPGCAPGPSAGWPRRLGSLVVLALVQRAEAAGDYDRDPEVTPAMAADEQAHALVVGGLAQRARARASGWLRAAVFGANDGLVSNFSLVLGMAGAAPRTRSSPSPAWLACSPGRCPWLPASISVRSQRELLEAASHELDGPTLRALAEQEA